MEAAMETVTMDHQCISFSDMPEAVLLHVFRYSWLLQSFKLHTVSLNRLCDSDGSVSTADCWREQNSPGCA
jgi:hypothetical protein